MKKLLAPLGVLIAATGLVFAVSPVRAPAPATNDAQLVLRTSGELLHTIRSTMDQTWTGLGDVLAETGQPSGMITHLATTVMNGELNIVTTDANGVYLSVRRVDGTWAGMQRIAACAAVTSVAVAGVNGELQVVVATDAGANL
ncbi:hypothetical protein ACFQ1S_45015, partial [Kibdelosporangium lantanae]